MSTLSTLSSIGENLRTQDNRITAEPIFLVQQKVRDCGYDPDYTDKIAWLDQDGEVDDPTEFARLEAEYEDTDEEPEGYTRTGYQDRWETVQPFFTEKGAKDYLAINSHNLHETRIYVDSAYRNAEWQAVRKHLMTLDSLHAKIAKIANDFIPDNDSQAPQALQEMREALEALELS